MAKFDRKRVEELLPWHFRAALTDLLPLWGVRHPDRWSDHPHLRDFLTLTAVNVLQDRGVRRGLSRTAALRVACLELGLGLDATRRRLARAREKYLNSAA